jgi:hypothetical protein
MTQFRKKHLDEIMKKMCEMVGCDVKTFDFKFPEWYYMHIWSEETQDEFRVWLKKYFMKKLRWKKAVAEREVLGFCFYEWTTNEERHKEALEKYQEYLKDPDKYISECGVENKYVYEGE